VGLLKPSSLTSREFLLQGSDEEVTKQSSILFAESFSMLVPRNVPIVDEVALRSIHVGVNAFIRKFNLPIVDRDDLIQDVALHLIQQAENFNPTVGAWSTFVKCVIRSKLASIRRASKTKKNRKFTRTVSLNEKTRDQDGRTAEFGSLVEEGESTSRKLRKIRSTQSHSELKLDVHIVVRKLKPELRAICKEFLSERNITEASEELEQARATTHRRIKRIHETMTEYEIHQYL